MKNKFKDSIRIYTLYLIAAAALLCTACQDRTSDGSGADVSGIPDFSGVPYVVVNDNVPDFPEKDMTAVSFESYSELDELGRCGPAYANIGTDLMPTAERGSIGEVKPSGWHTDRYDFIDGESLYNRCHLIGYMLTAENANPENLITGTRYLNKDGMLPFENMVADFIRETGKHVLYRVTPVFEGDNLIASGVLMEARSVEDGGTGIMFSIYCYNVQPGVVIDYTNGDNRLDESYGAGPEEEGAAVNENGAEDQTEEKTYILNKNTHVFHYPDCPGVQDISDKNKRSFTGTREEVLALSGGYKPCGICRP